MKRTFWVVTLMIIGMMVFGLVNTQPANAWTNEDSRPFHHWLWENEHATMINALLITANDAIMQHKEEYVKMAQDYSVRDPLLKVYGLRKVCDDSDKDAFLVGLKANNLIYLIHTADENPEARKWAIKDLKLLNCLLDNRHVNKEFQYWAELLEEGRYPSTRLSHVYVHYTVDVGDAYYDFNGVDKRFFYWLGYMINDYSVANLCGFEEWIKEDQTYLSKLYSIRKMGYLTRSTLKDWWVFNGLDLSNKENVDKGQVILDGIKGKYMDRRMGNKW